MTKAHCISVLVMLAGFSCISQKAVIPDLSKVNDAKVWTVFNRRATFDNAIHLDSKEGDGFARLNDITLENGRIELDIKGINKPGGSFVGIAFHGLNDSTYDAVYFRPFNFKNPERKTHAVQYISHPQNTWFRLRENFPDKYESAVDPVPNPDDWFHVIITVQYPTVKVYVNNSNQPSLIVEQLCNQTEGWVGLWVGNFSEGDFRNLKITRR
jgi:hypothetical protein